VSRWAERREFWRRWHSYVLARKGVDDDGALRAAIRDDRVVALAVARTLLSRLTTRALLNEFFLDRADVRDDVVAVADEDLVNHIGFQVREPLDVFLEGVAHRAPRLDLDVVGAKRFTASESFREQVGAFAEMAQIWVRRGDLTVELELFDIHRPNPRGTAARQRDGLRSLLAADDIWHYGVRITDEAAVEALHERFLLVTRDDARFRLRSDRPIANPWHGSVHTKLINLELELEVEFLTYQVGW
jgi:hypothetical protein